LVKASFLQEYRTEVIPNDPDFSHFKPSLDNSWRRERGLEGKYLILGVANKWEPRKGLRFLIELSENLRPDELLVVVGQQPRGERLPHNCIAVPHVTSSTELAEIYSAADIFVNPTLEDNYPTANLEALACGTPVITFDSGGSGETVARGSGLVLGSRTTASIRTAIDSMRQELRTVDIMSPRGLLHVQERSMAEKYLGLYNDILGRGENSDGQSHPSS
jgi:glycosyltransferase involved in cell wall biosynthesis